MSLTSAPAKRREGAEPEDKSPNSLMREGREERGEGGGGEGKEDGEMRSMTSRGSIHSLLGTTCTPVHRDPRGSFAFSPVIVPVAELIPYLLFCCLSSFRHRAVGQSMPGAPAVTSLAKVVGAVSVEVPPFLAL